jgi:hypothetical protein
MVKSLVAGVVDRKGGMRVVVTDGPLSCHVQPGERLYVLPNYQVQEPVPFADIPALVARVERYVAKQRRKP